MRFPSWYRLDTIRVLFHPQDPRGIEYVSERHQKFGIAAHFAPLCRGSSAGVYSNLIFNLQPLCFQLGHNFFIDPQLRAELDPITRLTNRGAVAAGFEPAALVARAAGNAPMDVVSGNFRAHPRGAYAVTHASDCYSNPTISQ
jgi:hypothetical protein